MKNSRKSKLDITDRHLGRAIALTVILLVLLFCIAIDVEAQDVKQVRCNLYEDGGKPTKIRLAFDFNNSITKLSMSKTGVGPGSGFVEDIVFEPTSGGNIFSNSKIKYGNAGKMVKISFDGGVLHLKIQQQWELSTSKVNYLSDSKVAYTDLKIAARKEMPKAMAAKPELAKKPMAALAGDTVFIEKVVYDTVIIEKIIHDTVFIDKLEYKYVDKESMNLATDIDCKYLTYWWADPDFRVEILFSKSPVDLQMEQPRSKLRGMPEGYKAMYIIKPKDRKLTGVFLDSDINYIHCDDEIIIKPDKNVCYVLVKESLSLKAGAFVYDQRKKSAQFKMRFVTKGS